MLAFYEPLNEHLSGLTLGTLPEARPENWDSRHPSVRPYFEEFAPLMSTRRRGVAGLDRSFAFNDFFSAQPKRSRKLHQYLRSLLDLAESSGKTPVLKFCRSLGRAEWMRRTFPDAAHLAVVRDPRAQWLSAWRLAEHGSPYFIAAPLAILARESAHPPVASVLDAFGLRLANLKNSTFEKSYAICHDLVASTPVPVLYRAYLAFWILTNAAALPHAELIVDSDLLAASSAYRKTMQDRIAAVTGITVDLDSAHQTPDSGLIGNLSPLEVERAHITAMNAYAAVRHKGPEDGGDIIADKLTGSRALLSHAG